MPAADPSVAVLTTLAATNRVTTACLRAALQRAVQRNACPVSDLEDLMSCCDETTARVPRPTVAALPAQGRGASSPASSRRRGHARRGAGQAASSSPIAASFCAACPTKSRARPATSRSTGSMSNSSTPAAAAPRCRRWSAARSIMPPPRSTSPSPPSPRAPTSSASPSPAGCRCSPLSPRRRPPTRSRAIKDLEGTHRRAFPALGNADHALTLYLLTQAKADASKVKFATMGVNLLEALRQGQIDAGLVQEPALTLLQRSGARVLVNAMDLDRRPPLSRRHLRIHGRRGARQGDRAAQGRDGRR